MDDKSAKLQDVCWKVKAEVVLGKGGGSKGGSGRKHRGVKGSKAKQKARSMRLAF